MEKFKFVKECNPERSKYPVISSCPVCHGDLYVVKLACDQCSTSLEGKFTLSKFNYLDSQKLYFIEVFVKNRGNIKAVEKEMDISYPTVKKLLDDVIVGLGYAPDQGAPAAEEPAAAPAEAPSNTPKLSKLQIIEKLQKGELSVIEAAELLKKNK
jgi:hypothetical protein